MAHNHYFQTGERPAAPVQFLCQMESDGIPQLGKKTKNWKKRKSYFSLSLQNLVTFQ